MRLFYNEKLDSFFLDDINLLVSKKDSGLGYKPTPELQKVIAVSVGDYTVCYEDTGAAPELIASKFFRENSLRTSRAIFRGDRVRINKAVVVTIKEMVEDYFGDIFEIPKNVVYIEGSKEYRALTEKM